MALKRYLDEEEVGRVEDEVARSVPSQRTPTTLERESRKSDGGEEREPSPIRGPHYLIKLRHVPTKEEEEATKETAIQSRGGVLGMRRRSVEMEEPTGLIMPKKVINPCLDSSDRQNLHRELLFNQKIGRNVLNQKSELQRAIEKHRENQTKKELEQKKLESRTPLQRVIEERAKRLEMLEKSGSDDESSEAEKTKPEFLEIHAWLRAKMEAK